MDLQRTLENLEKRGFHAHYFATGAQAAEFVLSQVNGRSVGIGGSKTVEALGLYERLCERSDVAWHWRQPDADARERAAAAAVYLTSANAIAETGEIVNIDGNGNRVASMCYGHEQLIILAGTNKLTPDLSAAIDRARNVASPLNARRFRLRTPCAVSEPMRCHDCASPERICRGMTILMNNMRGIGRTDVVLIGEELGY